MSNNGKLRFHNDFVTASYWEGDNWNSIIVHFVNNEPQVNSLAPARILPPEIDKQ